MGIDTAEYADLITKGKYSEYREKSETLAAENMTLVKEITTLAAESTAKDAKITTLAAESTAKDAKITTLAAESTAKDAKITTLAEEKAAFTAHVVLDMRSDNKTVEEISKKLKLSMADVARILEDSIEKT
jgi:predicted nuclease with TOPRIM domain